MLERNHTKQTNNADYTQFTQQYQEYIKSEHINKAQESETHYNHPQPQIKQETYIQTNTMQESKQSNPVESKKVGVVIPIYNVAKYLRECLDSVCNQTYKNLEVILINDGSTDTESLEIAKEYTQQDTRFILFDKENGGLSSARNVGIDYFNHMYNMKLDVANQTPCHHKGKNLDLAGVRNDNYTNANLMHITIMNENMSHTDFNKRLQQTQDSLHNYSIHASQQQIYNNKLLSFTIQGDNPYNIHKVYKSSKILHQLNITINKNETLAVNNNSNSISINNTSNNVTKDKGKLNNANNPINIKNLNSTKNFDNTDTYTELHNSATPQIIKEIESFIQTSHIDYIIFLDSDDFWKPNCIEECIKHANGVDIVWFDYEYYYDGVEEPKKKWKTLLEIYDYTQMQEITAIDWLQRSIQKHPDFFGISVSTLINFQFLTYIKLHFMNKVLHEDIHFQTLLFFHANNLLILPQKLYTYRIRPNSSGDYQKKYDSTIKPPHYIQEIYIAFNKDIRLSKEYHRLSSWLIMLNEIETIISQYTDITTIEYEKSLLMRKAFYPLMCSMASSLAHYPEDPLNLIPKMPNMKHYIGNNMKRFKRFKKIAVFYPQYYKFCIPFILLYRKIKAIERVIKIWK